MTTNNPFSLENKTILVTGASSGIGRAIAVACSELGAKLIITGRNKERLKQTLEMLSGTDHLFYAADLTIDSDLSALIDFVPQLDGFVSNAGIAQPMMLQFVEKQDVNTVINTNAISVIHLTRLLLQDKKLKKGASVVFISSINGNQCAYLGSSIYAASKSMLNGFMKATALELAPKKIRVNSIQPGMIDTDLLDNSAVSKEDLDKDKLKYPLKRYGKPEEIAYAAAYLLSDTTQWMTGSNLKIDGGYTLQ